jgi:hypothetical protein
MRRLDLFGNCRSHFNSSSTFVCCSCISNVDNIVSGSFEKFCSFIQNKTQFQTGFAIFNDLDLHCPERIMYSVIILIVFVLTLNPTM